MSRVQHLPMDKEDPMYKSWKARGYDEYKTASENLRVLNKNIQEDITFLNYIMEFIDKNLPFLMRIP